MCEDNPQPPKLVLGLLCRGAVANRREHRIHGEALQIWIIRIGIRCQQPVDHLNELQVRRLRSLLRRRWSRGRGGGGRLLGGRVGACVLVVVTAAAEGGDDRDRGDRRQGGAGGQAASAGRRRAWHRLSPKSRARRATSVTLGPSRPSTGHVTYHVHHAPRTRGTCDGSCDRSRHGGRAHVARTVAGRRPQPGDVSATATRARASTTASSYSGR